MVAVIVGAGPMMGASLARRFGSDGEPVALVARRPRTLGPLEASLKAIGRRVATFEADAASAESLSKAFDEITNWGDEVTALIYNAAVLEGDEARDLTAERLHVQMNTNLYGAVSSVQRVLSSMLARGKGTILLTGGGLAINPAAGWSALAIGKAALRAYAHALHKSVAGEGVHVATVTICGVVEHGTLFDPDLIADRYWELHMQPAGAFEPEIIYQPEGSNLDYNEPG